MLRFITVIFMFLLTWFVGSHLGDAHGNYKQYTATLAGESVVAMYYHFCYAVIYAIAWVGCVGSLVVQSVDDLKHLQLQANEKNQIEEA